MESFSLIKCPQFLDNAIAPPAKEIGITLSNIFYAIFSPLNFNVEKLKIRQANNLKKYEIDIQTELSKIPEEKLVEPPLSIVGPALEASKFYIENDELRKMFARLIASSMSIDTYSKSHPSFVEIIKQLSPIDASNFRIISASDSLPIAEYRINLKNGTGSKAIRTNVFLSNPYYTDQDLIAASITNLERLGLVSTTYTSYLVPESIYSIFDNDNLYKNLTTEIKDRLEHDPSFDCNSAQHLNGIVLTTPFGKNFASICL